jgi:hypothetical protein
MRSIMCIVSGVLLLMAVSITLSSCAGPALQPGETRMVEQVPDSRPEWISKIPESRDGNMFFRGFRTRASSLDNGNTDARQNAIQQVVEMIGAMGLVDYTKARVEAGIPEDDKDFSNYIEDGFKLVARNIAKGMKEVESYHERVMEGNYDGSVKYYYNYYILISYPEAELKRSVMQAFKEQEQEARRERDKKAEDFAKRLREQLK